MSVSTLNLSKAVKPNYFVSSTANFIKIATVRSEKGLVKLLNKLLGINCQVFDSESKDPLFINSIREYLIENLAKKGLVDVSPFAGSCYFFTEDGLYRLSDHWGQVAACRWTLDDETINVSKFRRDGKKPSKLFLGGYKKLFQGKVSLGFVRWEDLKCDPIDTLNVVSWSRETGFSLEFNSTEKKFSERIFNILNKYNLVNEAHQIIDFKTPAMAIEGLIEDLHNAVK